jgi:23S rRNA (uracil1939-C5)-methyltransferase
VKGALLPPEVGSLMPPLTVEMLANGGSGLARHQGRVIFIPHTAVGDVVRCRIRQSKKNYAHAELVEVLEKSAQRRTPPCPVAGECGGCQWQHLPYPEQLAWKERLFRETLSHQCGIPAGRMTAILPAPEEWHYRSRAQVKCYAAQGRLLTGFYRPRSHYVVAMERCPLLAPELNQLLTQLRSALDRTGYARYIPQIDLACDDFGKCAAVVHYIGSQAVELGRYLRRLALTADLFVQRGRKAELISVQGDGYLTILVDQPDLPLQYRLDGFAQINLSQNRNLVAKVIRLADLRGTENILDLYCGMGNFSLPLARRARRVLGIEEAPQSIASAGKNAHVNAIETVDFFCSSAERVFAESVAEQDIDLVVLDPPRSGAYELMKQLLKKSIPRVLYVSCNPQTLARDLKPLIHGGYELIETQPVDMFPQTAHCESLSLLQRDDR